MGLSKLGPYKGLFHIRALLRTIGDSGLIRDCFNFGPYGGLFQITALLKTI